MIPAYLTALSRPMRKLMALFNAVADGVTTPSAGA